MAAGRGGLGKQVDYWLGGAMFMGQSWSAMALYAGISYSEYDRRNMDQEMYWHDLGYERILLNAFTFEDPVVGEFGDVILKNRVGITFRITTKDWTGEFAATSLYMMESFQGKNWEIVCGGNFLPKQELPVMTIPSIEPGDFYVELF